MDKALADRINKAKKMGSERNYFKLNTQGEADIIDFSVKTGFTGRTILVRYRVVSCEPKVAGALCDLPGAVVATPWKPDDAGIKGEMAVNNVLTLISEALGGAEVTGEDILECDSEGQPLRGLRVKFSVPPAKKDPKMGFPRFRRHEDNSPEAVMARRVELDKTNPIERF